MNVYKKQSLSSSTLLPVLALDFRVRAYRNRETNPNDRDPRKMSKLSAWVSWVFLCESRGTGALCAYHSILVSLQRSATP